MHVKKVDKDIEIPLLTPILDRKKSLSEEKSLLRGRVSSIDGALSSVYFLKQVYRGLKTLLEADCRLPV